MKTKILEAATKFGLIIALALLTIIIVDTARADIAAPLKSYPAEWCFAVTLSSEEAYVRKEAKTFGLLLRGFDITVAQAYLSLIAGALTDKIVTQEEKWGMELECLGTMEDLLITD